MTCPQCKAVIVAFCCSLLSIQLSAQPGTDALDASLGPGIAIRNHPDFPDVEHNAWVASIGFNRRFNGYKPWHRYYNFPRTGISLTGGAIGNNAVLGYFAGAMVNMEFEKEISDRWQWAPVLAFGASWFSRPYDENRNPENVVIGSRFTFLAAAGVATRFRVSESFALTGQLSVYHASNSHFKLPNIGLNLPAFTLGVRNYFPNTKEKLPDTDRLATFTKIRFNLRLALGVNESGSSTNPVNGPKYPIYLVSAGVSRMFSPVNKVTAVVEAWYNRGAYNYIVSQEFYEEKQHEKSVAAAVVLGHEFLMGRWGLITTGGIYFYNPFYREKLRRNEINGLKDQLKSWFPARLGVQYHLRNTNYTDHNNLFLGIYIKTNFGQADFLESGLGYVF